MISGEEHEEEPPQGPLDVTTEPPLTPMVLSPHRDSSHTPSSPLRPRDFSPLPEDVQTPTVIDLPVSAARDEPMVVDTRPTATPDRAIGIKLEQVAYVLTDHRTTTPGAELDHDVGRDISTDSQPNAEINIELDANSEIHEAESDTQVYPEVDEAHEPQIDEVPEPDVHEAPEPGIEEVPELEIRRVGDVEVDEALAELPHVDAHAPEVGMEPQEVTTVTQVHVETQALPDDEEVHSEPIQDRVDHDGQIHAEVDARDISDVALDGQVVIDVPIESEARMEARPSSHGVPAATLRDQVDINISVEPEADMELQGSPEAEMTVQIRASSRHTTPSTHLDDDGTPVGNVDASTDDIHPPEAVVESQTEAVNVGPESTPTDDGSMPRQEEAVQERLEPPGDQADVEMEDATSAEASAPEVDMSDKIETRADSDTRTEEDIQAEAAIVHEDAPVTEATNEVKQEEDTAQDDESSEDEQELIRRRIEEARLVRDRHGRTVEDLMMMPNYNVIEDQDRGGFIVEEIVTPTSRRAKYKQRKSLNEGPPSFDRTLGNINLKPGEKLESGTLGECLA
ncbi:hypothetical protein IW261DRAFT_123918 [Armillaria novae-zelandiae]|uniref:Uncharacterized protein n=1 Tax=Armillaria novae-zelandiae TaxID=153914 RepID=A0AA39PA77_9AGAR|nr:hypothetical protein IW261DRAFT_123918 [Armillaria novae-zelandiae]